MKNTTSTSFELRECEACGHQYVRAAHPGYDRISDGYQHCASCGASAWKTYDLLAVERNPRS